MAATNSQSQDIPQHLESLYNAYRHAPTLSQKALFFSPTCLQICRPEPSYSAINRTQIVQYLHDAAQGKMPVELKAEAPDHADPVKSGSEEEHPGTGLGCYTVRPLRECEHDFGPGAATAAVGLTPLELEARAQAEGWVGMRVDLWDESAGGLLVKVHYWWRLEAVETDGQLKADGSDSAGKAWRQCLHDIMYLGPRDGTEGEEGLAILR